MILVKIHIVCAISFCVLDEIWNLANPRPIPNRDYILCNWNPKDYYHIEDAWILRKEFDADNVFKRKARESYFKKKGLQK